MPPAPQLPPTPASPVLPPEGEESAIGWLICNNKRSPPPLGEGDPEGVEGEVAARRRFGQGNDRKRPFSSGQCSRPSPESAPACRGRPSGSRRRAEPVLPPARWSGSA